MTAAPSLGVSGPHGVAMPLWAYVAAGALFLVVAWWRRLDVDAGGYDDTFRTRDKAEHAVIAFFLTAVAGVLTRQPFATALATTALGFGWELMQCFPRAGFTRDAKGYLPTGFFSWRDVVSDAAGALVAAGVLWAVGVGR